MKSWVYFLQKKQWKETKFKQPKSLNNFFYNKSEFLVAVDVLLCKLKRFRVAGGAWRVRSSSYQVYAAKIDRKLHIFFKKLLKHIIVFTIQWSINNY